MKITLKKILKKEFLFACVLTLFVGRVYFHAGFPYTHDGENHLARFANYMLAMRELQFPPRFAPNLFNHFGYPVFDFNYPLANIFSLPFSLLKMNYELSFKIIAIAAIMFGVWGVFQWMRNLHFSRLASSFAMAVFAISPYLLNTVFYRGNIGEILALSILPWIFWSVEILRTQRKLQTRQFLFLVGIWTYFFLAHNTTAVFGLPLIVGYGIERFRMKKEAWMEWLKVGAVSLSLSLWFWIPALLEKSATIVDSARLNNLFDQHFPTLAQLLFAPMTFGYSYVGSIDSLSFSLGVLQLLIFFVGVVLFLKCIFIPKHDGIKDEIKERINWFLLSLLFFLALLFVLQLHISLPVWNLFRPIVRFIQFPWRLALFWEVLIVPVAAYLFDRLSHHWKIIFVLVLIWQTAAFSRMKAVDYFHHDKIDYDFFSQSTSTENENLPKTFTLNTAVSWSPQPDVTDGLASIQIQSWRGSTHAYHVEAKTPVTIVEPTMNFDGWQTTIQNSGFSLLPYPLPYINSPEIGGRIAYTLPTGSYDIKTQFTQWTWPRIVGNTVSIMTAVALCCFAFLQMRRNRA